MSGDDADPVASVAEPARGTMTGHRPAAIFVTIALVVTGCDGERFAPTSSTLSATEATLLARTVLSQFRALTDEPDTPFSLPRATRPDGRSDATAVVQRMGPRDSITVVHSSEVSAPCEDDRGVARLTRTLQLRIDAETMSGNAEGDLALSLSQCAISTDGGHRFVLTADPHLTMHAAFTVANGEPVGDAIDGRLTGSFTWQLGNREGRCDVDLTVTMLVASASLRARGDFCALAVDQTV